MDDCDSSSDDEPLARLLPQHSPSTTPTKKIGTCKEAASEDSLPVASLLPEQSPPLATTPTTTPRKNKKGLLTPNSKSLPQPSSKRTSADRREEEKRCSAVRGFLLERLEEGGQEHSISMEHLLSQVQAHCKQMAAHSSSKEEEEALANTDMISGRTVVRLVKSMFTANYMKHSKTLLGLRWKPAVLDHLQTPAGNTDQIDNIRTLIAKVDRELEESWASVSKFGGEQLACSHFADLWNKRNKLVSTLVRLYKERADSLLQDAKSGYHLSLEQKTKLSEEMKMFENMVNIGVRDRVIDDVPETFFGQLAESLDETCPLIHSILWTLIVTDRSYKNKLKTNAVKLRSATHALCGLLDLRSSRASNDVSILFGLVAVSYGAGKQFVSLLQHLGLSESWDTLMGFMEGRLNSFQSVIEREFGDNGPVIFAYDNINIFRAVRHMRVMKGKPQMWNFTVRMAIKPNLEGIKELFETKDTAEIPQKPVEDVTVDDVFIDAHPELAKIWEEAQDSLYRELLDIGLNQLPEDTQLQSDKTPAEQKAWLSTQSFKSANKYAIRHKPAKPSTCKKSDITVLPLSTENEATLTGTASIIEEFAQEFSIPIERKDIQYLPFNEHNIQFDITAARKRYEFNQSIQQHRVDQATLLNTIAADTWDEGEEDGALDEEDPEIPANPRHLGSLRERWKKEDENMKSVLSDMEGRLNRAERVGNVADLDEFAKYVLDTKDNWNSIVDHLGRSLVHVVVETGNVRLLKYIVAAGVNVDSEEGCGATPLCLAVLRQDVETVQYLLETQAVSVDGLTFVHFPSPLALARRMGHNAMMFMLEQFVAPSTEDRDIYMQFSGGNVETINEVDDLVNQIQEVNVNDDGYVFHRKNAPNVTVGDGLTTKNHRHCRLSDEVAFHFTSEMPGDLHAAGYVEECFAKSQGPGGLYYIITDVLKRKKIKKETYGKDKFKDNNLQLIREANRDVAYGYGLSAVLEFRQSDMFPSEEEFSSCGPDKEGKSGHNIACDEYVESYIVKPLKQYCSGQTTLKTLQRLNVNLQLVGSARACYKSRSGFDVHNTKRHSEPSALADQIFVCLYCIKEQYFHHDIERQEESSLCL
ncbi:hypothetical protein Bbelb_320200 [Branchiostoma belcheri]|nr:hypothetical protein Bbelb_320200 [Branchiostoma belcheri]